MTVFPNFGAFVISLDFEFYWGVRDFLPSNEAYWENLNGEAAAIREIIGVFEEFEIAATWATVGFLFAGSSNEALRFSPDVKPNYEKSELSPYEDLVNDNLKTESVFHTNELIDLIRRTPHQEIATHTFSHYYCLEPGQTEEAFAADIDSAIAVAKEKSIAFQSIVFPRNQHNPKYDKVLSDRGIFCYRGNQNARMYHFDRETLDNPYYRVNRLADTFLNVSGINTFKWNEIWHGSIANVPASVFLRPVSKSSGMLANLQFRRIESQMEYAAKNGQVFHLWWHPHNFGINTAENILFLRRILKRFTELKQKYDMQSLSMAEVAQKSTSAGL